MCFSVSDWLSLCAGGYWWQAWRLNLPHSGKRRSTDVESCVPCQDIGLNKGEGGVSQEGLFSVSRVGNCVGQPPASAL